MSKCNICKGHVSGGDLADHGEWHTRVDQSTADGLNHLLDRVVALERCVTTREAEAGDRLHIDGVLGTLVTCVVCNGVGSLTTYGEAITGWERCPMCDGDKLLHVADALLDNEPDPMPEQPTPDDANEVEKAEPVVSDVADLVDALADVIEVALWMSGSPSFAPGGEAADGWLDASNRIHAARAVLESWKTDPDITCDCDTPIAEAATGAPVAHALDCASRAALKVDL